MADDVQEFIRVHNIKLPALIGHSMYDFSAAEEFLSTEIPGRGAKVAMTVALRSPKSLRALVSVDNAPIDANLPSDFRKYLDGMREIEAAEVKKQAEADQILRKYEDALPIRQFLMTNLVKAPHSGSLRLRIPIKTLMSSLNNMADFPFKSSDEARYKGPTLFVRGTRSHYVADDVLPVIGQFFPKFTVRDMDCGHWVISEQPEAFLQAVVSFFRDSDNE
ncbi:MAG: hypothetical protein Q9211_000345 [Gyalolechia sp. 1 TL-2023]